MHNLIRLYPLMMGTYVPSAHSSWRFLNKILVVVELTCTFKFATPPTYFLDEKVENLLLGYHDIFPDNS